MLLLVQKKKKSLKNPRSFMCFDAPFWYELFVEGSKIAGSAQTRQKGVILQHDFILLEIDEDKLFSVFNYPNDHVKERMQRTFRSKAITINAIAGSKISIEEPKEAFYKGFASALDINLEPYTLSEEEEAYVEELARTKHGSDKWNFKC